MTNKTQNEEILENTENNNKDKKENKENKNNKNREDTKENIQEKKSEQELQIEKLKNENAELNDKLLRTTADIQNMKRRSTEERVNARFDGAKNLLLPITKTIDDLNRAFSHIPEDLQENEFIKSLKSIEENLQKTLSEQGVDFFAETSEKFDANLHDSMMMDPNTEKDIIAQVFEKGVSLKGKVVRHAKVSVGSK